MTVYSDLYICFTPNSPTTASATASHPPLTFFSLCPLAPQLLPQIENEGYQMKAKTIRNKMVLDLFRRLHYKPNKSKLNGEKNFGV